MYCINLDIFFNYCVDLYIFVEISIPKIC